MLDTLLPNSPPVAALSHVDLRLTADAGRWLGWAGTILRVEAIADHGAKPNSRVGSPQGMSNIEVKANGVRLYSFWVAHDFGPAINVLAGLYDLNSEFYVTDGSSTLVHPAFGVGAELAQTGR
ncbi:MAG: porin, partial [Pseudomonadota bacterium]|nr:porin [Pseudomonadota bacterium]